MKKILPLILSLNLLACDQDNKLNIINKDRSKNEFIKNTTYTSTKSHEIDIKSKTVALVDDVGHVYCAGVWVGENIFITAYHCIEDYLQFKKSIKNIKIIYLNSYSREYKKATLLKINKENDLAMFHSKDNNHSTATINLHSNIGESVHTMGHGNSIPWTYHRAKIAAYRFGVLNNERTTYIQLASKVSKGDSGSGIFNNKGELLGIISFRERSSFLGFAVKSKHIEELATK